MQFARLSAGRAKRIVYGMFGGGDADSSKMMDWKRCIVGGRASIETFDLDERPNLARAEKYWAEAVKGSHSFLRARRLICRMPRYRSGDELVRAVIEKYAATQATR
jgi:hypothetical protein